MNKVIISLAFAGLILGATGAEAQEAPKPPNGVDPTKTKSDAKVAPLPKLSEEQMRRAVVDGKVVQLKARPTGVAPGNGKLVSSLKVGVNGSLKANEDVMSESSFRAMTAFMLGQAKNEQGGSQVEGAMASSTYVLVQNPRAHCYTSELEKVCASEIVVFQTGALAPANKQVPVAFRESRNTPWRVAMGQGDDAGVKVLLDKIVKGEKLVVPEADKPRETPPEHLKATRPANVPELGPDGKPVKKN